MLFLVDRNNLGDQTLREFRHWTTPDDGRKFTELYTADKLTSSGMVGSSKVVISTIQRVWSVLKGQEVPDTDDPNIDEFAPDAPVEVQYNALLPPEAFDLVIVDECHRSIYGLWRGVIEYFDAHVVGLTATPMKQTFAFFNQNLVAEYTYAESVADGVNVDFDIYRIKTQITEARSSIEAGIVVPVMDKRTRRQRYEALDEDMFYTPSELDRRVMSKDQIRTVFTAFKDRLFTEIFPGRSVVPKTLVFAKDDNHAEEIVTQIKEVFGKGNDFAAKITYNARDPKALLQQFRNASTLRFAVTVDMIATGTDVKPIECVFFMRDVRSASYFEQMKGRGARTIDNATFTITADETATLASRPARLERQLNPAERAEINEVAGQPFTTVTASLITVTDPDVIAEAIAAAPIKDGKPDEAAAMRAVVQSGLDPANCRLLDPLEAAQTGSDDGAHALLVLGFESADHPVDHWLDVALALCASHGGTWSDSDASAAGGTITHHHAVGRDHRESYDRQRPEPFAAALRAAKSAVDPAGRLNPGVLVD